MRLLPRELDGAAPAVRRSLAWSSADGALFAVMDGLGSPARALYAIALGMPTLTIGLLETIPVLAGSLSQLLSPALERACGGRKRAVILGCLVHALSWLAMSLVAELPPGLGREAALVAIVSIGMAGWFVSIPPWGAWMGDLVPPKVRERTFAWRAMPIQLCTAASILAMGAWLHAREDSPPVELLSAFRWLFVAAAGARLLSCLCLCFQDDPGPARAEPGATEDSLRVPQDLAGFARVARYFALFHFALFLSAPYFGAYMRSVRLDYRTISWIMAITFPFKMLFLPAWSRAAARYGNRRVILVSGALTSLLPWLWLFTTDWRRLMAFQAVGGMLWGGIELCELPYLMDVTRPAERTRRLAGYFSLRSLCACGGSVTGDLAMRAGARGGLAAPAFLLAFWLSGAGRILVSLWGRRTLPEPAPDRRHSGPRRVLVEVLTLR